MHLMFKSQVKKSFGIKSVVKPTFFIPHRAIEEERKDLVQHCDRCKEVTGHIRIKYGYGQLAIRCGQCAKLTPISLQF